MLLKLAVRFDYLNQSTTNKLLEYLFDDSVKFIVSEEISKESKKQHYHIYAEYDVKIKLDSYMKKLRRKFNESGLNKSQFCVQKCKNYNNYMVYLIKDMKIIESFTKNINEDELITFKEQSMKINNDKKLPIYKKLYNRWIELEKNNQPKPDIYSFIANTLILEFDTFCRRAQIIEYAVYIQIRLSDGKKTQTILNDAYGIMDWNDYNERKRDKQYKEYLDNNKFLESDEE